MSPSNGQRDLPSGRSNARAVVVASLAAAIALFVSSGGCGGRTTLTADHAGDDGSSAGSAGTHDGGKADTSVAGGGSAGGFGTDASPGCAVQVSAGYNHTCALRGDGTLWCWGSNWNGELGDGTTAGLSCENGMRCRPTPAQVTALGANVVEVSAGAGHSCALKADGTLWCWGANGYGELGDGTAVNNPSPVQVVALGTDVSGVSAGYSHTCALKIDGTLWCWGYNCNGQLGDGTTVLKPSPVQVTALGTSVSGVSAGTYHTCARKSDGSLWCWGNNANGQIGDGTTSGQICDNGMPGKLSPVQVASLGTSVTGVSAGEWHTCARTKDGNLWCWGDNGHGQLGNATTVGLSSPNQVTALGASVVALSAGDLHTCAVRGDDTLWCWGNNWGGQIGDGTSAGPLCFNAEPCESSPVQVTALGAGVVEVSASGGHTCARKFDGTLWCWGGDNWGELGTGTLNAPACNIGIRCRPSPTQVALPCS